MMDASGPLPGGFAYRAEFISAAEERNLLDAIQRIEFSEVRMHGVVAKRRVAHFGYLYAFEGRDLTEGPPIPEFLLPLRMRAAELIDAAPDDLAEALLTYYPTGVSDRLAPRCPEIRDGHRHLAGRILPVALSARNIRGVGNG